MREKDFQQEATGLEIAVIGMSARFPGAPNTDMFWENLVIGRETIHFYTDDEMRDAGYHDEFLANPNVVKAWGWLDGNEYFDASFFSYTPMEARFLDPQVRITHEAAWHALEDAGYDTMSANYVVGVYIGANANFTWEAEVQMEGANQMLGWFSAKQLYDKDYIATRIAYKLNLRGPAFTMDSACSTSLTTIHTACQGLISGDCDMALAGGVSSSINNKFGYLYQEGLLSSPDGHCRAFDKNARGTCFGNGVGLVVLKRLEDAVADQDGILAVIRGSAINNDGSGKAGYTAPSVEGQSRAIATAHRMAEISAESIGYVETHGTGTALGDPVEIEGLKTAFNTEKRHFCKLGAVKTNFGHLEISAGVAGFIKTVLILMHKQIPPTLFFKSPNPKIDFENSPFVVNQQLSDWTTTDGAPRRAGVSSFGLGGTNAHAVLEEWYRDNVAADTRDQLLLLSARNEAALDRMSLGLARYLEANPDLSLADAAYTLQVGRRVFSHRRMMVCNDVPQAVRLLDAADSDRVKTYQAREDNPSLVFLFPGLGSQYVDMGRELYQSEPFFRERLDHCFKLLETISDIDVKTRLYPEPGSVGAGVDTPEVSQLAVFCFEYALASLLLHLGIRPHMMMGYSFGEYTAACISGVLELEDALKFITVRGNLIRGLPEGRMLSVPLSENQLSPILSHHPGISLAIDNGPSCVVSGSNHDVAAFEHQLKQKRIMCMDVPATHPLHSEQMAPVRGELENCVRRLKLNEPGIPYISNVTGKPVTTELLRTPGYFADHLEGTVRFSSGMQELLNTPGTIFLEVGPGRDISALVLRYIENSNHRVINLVRHPRQNVRDPLYLLGKIGLLWQYGVPIQWENFHDRNVRRISLPGYPFEKDVYPVGKGSKIFEAQALQNINQAAAATKRKHEEQWLYLPSWQRSHTPPVGPGMEPTVRDWLLFADETGLAELLAGKLEAAGCRVTMVVIGTKFSSSGSGTFTLNPGQEDDYRLLFNELSERMPGGIVHMWGVSPVKSGAPTQDEVEDTLQRLYFGLLQIARLTGDNSVTTETDDGFSKLRLIVVTDNMQDVVGGDNAGPVKSVVMGPINTIPVEFSHLQCVGIDLRVSDGIEPNATHLWRELCNQNPEPITAYRGNYRWQRIFKPLMLKRPEGHRSNEGDFQLKRGGVYLITGGLGGIGLVMARYLAADFHAKLVLIGRTDKGAEIAEAQLTELGADVMTAAADVCDQERMADVLKAAESRFGPVDGVLHCAGSQDGTMIQLRSKEDSLRVLAPKVTGTLVLYDLFKHRKPCFMIFFSSIAAVIPQIGQAAYAGANAFQDAMASYINSEPQNGGLRVISVNWDRWQGLGVAKVIEEMHRRLTGGVLEGGITADEGLRIFNDILGEGLNRVLVSVYDLENRLQDAYTFNAASFLAGVNGSAGSLTDNTSVQRLRPDMDCSYRAPVNPVEERLASLWGDFFGYEKVGCEDDFFQLGGDSLKALVLLPRINKEWGVSFTLTSFFQLATIENISAHIVDQLKEPEGGGLQMDADISGHLDVLSGPALTAVEERDYYPLSSTQERLYVLNRVEGNHTGYNLPTVRLLEGPIDIRRIAAVFQTIIDRYEIFRTSFIQVNGLPVQRIIKNIRFELEPYDADNADPQQIIRDFVRPFDLSVAPLLRAGVVRLAENRHQVLMDVHHIVFDGISFQLIFAQFSRLYSGEQLPIPTFQYKDYCRFQRNREQGDAMRRQEAFWWELFSGEPPLLNLPLDLPRPVVQSFAGRSLDVAIDEVLYHKLTKAGRNNGVTLFMMLTAMLTILLMKLSDQEDIVIGSPVSGRMHPELRSMPGMFVNTVLLRNYPQGNIRFDVFLQKVKENLLQVFENQEYPFEELVKKVVHTRDMSRNPLFDVMLILNTEFNTQFDTRFNTQAHGAVKSERDEVQMKIVPFTKTAAQVDLTFTFSQLEQGLALTVDYCTQLFKEETIRRFIDYFLRIVAVTAGDNSVLLNEIQMISDEEKKLLVETFNNTQTDYPSAKTIHHLFSQQAARTPNQPALCGRSFDGIELTVCTYGELDELSTRTAHFLQNRGVGPGQVVGILPARNIRLLIALLGILKSGAAYLPMDPEYPPARLNYLLEHSGCRLLLTEPQIITGTLESALKFDGEQVDITEACAYDKPGPPAGANAQDTAYIIYTSGSTGNPKGVMVQHRNAVNFITGMINVIDFAAGKTILALTTVSFDIFFLETLLPVTLGMRIALAGEAEQRDPVLSAKFIKEQQVDMVQMTPSRLGLLLEMDGSLDCLSAVTDLMVGGEAFPTELLEQLHARFKGNIYNMYGPTETTIWSSVKHLTNPAGPITIGTPIANTQMHITDRYGRLQPIGVVGELLISGDGVALGYHNNPQLTSKKFLTINYNSQTSHKTYKTGDLARRLPNGEIQFLGRLDQQIKIRGYRIELEEIEERLLTHPQLKEAVVTVHHNAGTKQLCAYLVCRPGQSDAEGIDATGLRAYLGELLPQYMIPAYFIPLEKLPLTANGKIDKKALPPPGTSDLKPAVGYVAPSGDNQEKLAELLQAILGVEEIGIHDNFFDIGGTSLNVVQAAWKIKEEFGVEIPAAVMFRNLTIQFLDDYITRYKDSTQSQLQQESVEKQRKDMEQAKKVYKNTVGKFKTLRRPK